MKQLAAVTIGLFFLLSSLSTPGVRHSHRHGQHPHTHQHAHSHTDAHHHHHGHSHGGGHRHNHGAHSHNHPTTVTDEDGRESGKVTPHIHIVILGWELTLPDFSQRERPAILHAANGRSHDQTRAAEIEVVSLSEPSVPVTLIAWVYDLRFPPVEERIALAPLLLSGRIGPMSDLPPLLLRDPPPVPPPEVLVLF